jgi:hypothetical protein
LKNKIIYHSARSRGIHLDAATTRSMTRKVAFVPGTVNSVGWSASEIDLPLSACLIDVFQKTLSFFEKDEKTPCQWVQKGVRQSSLRQKTECFFREGAL